MGQFKPMVKMMTDEPSVILKLKKGGKVAKKAVGGALPVAANDFKSMAATSPVGMVPTVQRDKGYGNGPVRGGEGVSAGPMRPSMRDRRHAMSPARGGMNPQFMKKGGKAEKHEDAAQDREMIKKAMAGKKFASGGLAKSGIIKTITNKTTKMVDGDKHDSAKGTKGVKEGKPGGFATGGVANGKAAGYKKGGSTNWENRPANDGDKFDPAHGTTGVRNSNGGGYKKGGSTKKAYATGGNVIDDGKAVKMPRHFVSKPVANSLQSGTFKKGGKVGKYASAGPVKFTEADFDKVNPVEIDETVKKTNRDLEEALNPISMAKELYGKARNYFRGEPKAPGSVTKTKESVTVSPSNKKRGGKVC